MNEKIKQLAEQCYETGPLGKDGWPEYSRLNQEKFAKLIVEECANQVLYTVLLEGDFDSVADILMHAHFQLKQHFEVEL